MYAISSSGGKDSTYAFYIAQQSGFDITHLFHVYNADTSRVRFHGYQASLVRDQAKALGLESILTATRSDEFDSDFKDSLEKVKQAGLKGIIFGNIFLEFAREFYQTRVEAAGLEYYDPLWGQPTGSVLKSFVNSGFRAVITAVWLNKLDRKYLGREIDRDFIQDIGKEGGDVCGENGEYHSLVYDGPCFKEPLPYRICGVHEEETNIYLDIRSAESVTG